MEPKQGDLQLPFPELGGDQPLIPVRMLNEHVYCPRLAYLEWVQGEWADSVDTVDGRHRHQRVDKPSGDLPAADKAREEQVEIHARSVTLSSNSIGLIAKLDLIEGEGDTVTPVDYKRGKRPHTARGVYDPERVQLCAQGLLLREHGYVCDEGAIYYVASKERVAVPFDDELLALTRNAIAELRAMAAGGRIPDPLVDSPKCPRCSLVTICLPDEVQYLHRAELAPRPLAVPHHEALPLYIQQFNAKLAKKGDVLEVSKDDQVLATARIGEVSQVVLMGNVYVTSPCLGELMQRDIPVTWHSYGGWFYGHTVGNGHKNVELRTAQYRISFNDAACLRVARGLVAAKIANSRTQLRRNWKPEEKPERLLADLKRIQKQSEHAENLETLLGIEGSAAALYFGNFRNTLKPAVAEDEALLSFDFTLRNRRPPTDPINAMLSFAYTLLARTLTVTLQSVGFDPFRGFYHQPRYGRPALALDLMEPFRPLLADSVVIQVINNGEVHPSDFVSAAGSVNLTPEGRKRFIAAFERRLSHEVTHPLFGYRLSYRRLLELQARLLGRFLLGELDDYPNFTTR
ncbi:CRISPR-associated endonuclease Cas4/Cas1 [Rhodanobacter sp. FW510-R12]|uniref:CRISPR-associated endonuclease Cas4/Cas1 n=1 Tax=unclassified Rhodanobacter TaxID=2621553 RepID=UPI0007A9FD6D|nr:MULTISPECIES: CRISPR-associated endonuclease Cas4/Cas1 [unclassified Rhodanobacter]KZC17646.1 CRISPR-associated endonuclease Cas4/Cas1 [Rhodanobacter sp. FW104-R8]KZC25496.1 CRISPR-associated endonuclease Cas4/Cas1 [Rhodanobacter sp. FW510-T8]KZC32222.1 CRISPR-associated endonuclease Cas4/Cas1 [Rhodanobacter sp. FW510-R10]